MQNPFWVATTALLLAAGGAVAHNFGTGELRVQHPWTRATPADARQAAAYMRIQNNGRAADRLIAADSLVAGRVELRSAAGPAPAIDLPARKSVRLEPGGVYLLLVDLKRPLLKGERIPILLRFERSGEAHVEVEVQSAESRRPRH